MYFLSALMNLILGLSCFTSKKCFVFFLFPWGHNAFTKNYFKRQQHNL